MGYLAKINCICYNASRLKRYESSTWTTSENPGAATPGFSIPFWVGGLSPRLVTDYLSPSNHLQTRWLITLAATAIARDMITSTRTPPSCCQYRGGNEKSISHPSHFNNHRLEFHPLPIHFILCATARSDTAIFMMELNPSKQSLPK